MNMIGKMLESVSKSDLNDIKEVGKESLEQVEAYDNPTKNYESSEIDDHEQKIDGSELTERYIICRNESLEGQEHPITGVRFEEKTIEHNGEVITGTFPEFESSCDVQLPEDLYEASNKEQFDYANKQLKDSLEFNPELKDQFSDEQLEQIENGDRPDGYVWHHNEEPGKIELVAKDIHDKTGHTGGQVIWGGGNENR